MRSTSPPARRLALLRPTLLGLASVASVLLATAPALADEPSPSEQPSTPAAPTATPEAQPPAAPPPSSDPAALPPWAPPVPPAPTTPPAPSAAEPAGADTPATAGGDGSPSRAEGLRLGLELGMQRAFSGEPDRLNANSPTLLPIGFDVAFRTSKTFLVGLHGYAAMASRDDCLSTDSCRGRAYSLGGHVEGMLARGRSYVTYLRYGIGYEVVYQGGQILDPSGHRYRGALDVLDLRFGADFTASRGTDGRTIRIGPYLGVVGGFLVNTSGVTHVSGNERDLQASSGSSHLWFVAGVRATFDP
jgi:hypothetical protein